MKALLTMASLLIILTAQAQTRTGTYQQITYENFTPGAKTPVVLQKRTGTIKIADRLILIDSAGKKAQAFTIVYRTEVEDYCYDDVPTKYGIQFLTLLQLSGNGLKAVKAILLFDADKRTITDIIFKTGKHKNITYTF